MATVSRSMLILAAGTLAASPGAALARQYAGVVLNEHSTYARVHVGEPVEIRLKAQGGTGYSWRPVNYKGKITSLSSRNSSGMPGGKEVQRFLFRSRVAGTYNVGFTYGQPWKGGAKRAKYRSFTIKVR
jgi:predicted secreted protein